MPKNASRLIFRVSILKLLDFLFRWPVYSLNQFFSILNCPDSTSTGIHFGGKTTGA
jgi:hypothetical protein